MLHGVDDYQWLMRDFQVYFVNSFNTQKAAEELDYTNRPDKCGNKIGSGVAITGLLMGAVFSCTLGALLLCEFGLELDKSVTREV